MDITVLCTSDTHPCWPHLVDWAEQHAAHHKVGLITDVNEANGGDLLLLISCSNIVTAERRSRYSAALVVHASDLPRGRGWSPHVWEIINGADTLTVSLIEAADPVDTGDIWTQRSLPIPRAALWPEIAQALFQVQSELMTFAVDHFDRVRPRPQAPDEAASYYRKRAPADSELDPHASIASQFNLIRVCDPDRFPAFFDFRGARFLLKLEKINVEA